MNSPEWYITPSELAGIVVDTLDDMYDFTRNRKVHPEDLVIQFSNAAQFIVAGIMFASTKIKSNNESQHFANKIRESIDNEDQDAVNHYVDKYETWKASR